MFYNPISNNKDEEEELQLIIQLAAGTFTWLASGSKCRENDAKAGLSVHVHRMVAKAVQWHAKVCNSRGMHAGMHAATTEAYAQGRSCTLLLLALLLAAEPGAAKDHATTTPKAEANCHQP
ncbi:unnamed protein product [Polarella glacialis]|uniref:Uncharacterized protein n=1 Tax=Polarella glacialis TaxID=89957 RepID=A0A813KLT9_POLGL|nr:unnamed protein product [Polarella glacialis]CAE8704699.1 unnamed protein product [Polarella glacialis]